MKPRFNTMIYDLVMREMLINGNDSTDLGKYVLEYKTMYTNINTGDMVYGDASLAILARLVDKESGQIVWGNIFYKKLIEEVHWTDVIDELNKIMNNIYNSSLDDKIEFINKPETLFRRPYANWFLVDPIAAEYFNDLNHVDNFDDMLNAVSLGGRFPKDALLTVGETYKSIIESQSFEKKR